jgi:cyanate lyase
MEKAKTPISFQELFKATLSMYCVKPDPMGMVVPADDIQTQFNEVLTAYKNCMDDELVADAFKDGALKDKP